MKPVWPTLTRKTQKLFVRDIGSSSGTFLNKSRLSPSGKESKNFPLKEGDILQFGVDYKGKPDGKAKQNI
jgi:pSer/pThr/pTyr-binding forkhead associated (FHA) protein